VLWGGNKWSALQVLRVGPEWTDEPDRDVQFLGLYPGFLQASRALSSGEVHLRLEQDRLSGRTIAKSIPCKKGASRNLSRKSSMRRSARRVAYSTQVVRDVQVVMQFTIKTGKVCDCCCHSKPVSFFEERAMTAPAETDAFAPEEARKYEAGLEESDNKSAVKKPI
jgi:hypothetical protein